jgi:hypothetical protein
MKLLLKSAKFAALVLGLTASATAQVAPWTQLTLSVNPATRERPATATDGNVLYLYGGQSGTTTSTYANLMAFNGTAWTTISATGTACGPRAGAVMAWDSARGKLVVFSGNGAAGVWATHETTTWEWDSAGGWSQKFPATVPDSRWLVGGSAYVPGVGVVFHGGNAKTIPSSATAYISNETWAWDGTNWTLLTNTGPTVQNGALVYRSATHDLIYFGGTTVTGGPNVADTFKYDVATNTWSQVVTATLPTSDVAGTTAPGLSAPNAYYHPLTGKVVIHGGQGNHPNSLASKKTWEFNGVDWTDVSDAASPNIRNSSAQWVSALGKAYSATGNSSNSARNWTLQHDVPVSTVVYCTAGTSTNGCVPSISATGVASLSAGSGFTLGVASVEGQKQGLIFYGITGRSAAPWGIGGTSFLCVKAPTQRTPAQSSGGTAGACDGTLSVDWLSFIGSTSTALGNPFSAGQVVNAQGWYRDPPAVKTTNLSDGLEFTVLP